MFKLLTQIFHRSNPNEVFTRRLAVINHELRRSLTIIATSAEILQKEGDRLEPEKQDQHWQRIHNQIQQLNDLLHAISIAAEQPPSPYPIRQAWIDVVAFCTRLVEDMQMETDRHPIRLTVYPDVLDPTNQPILACLDAQQLQMILVNLFANSIKCTAEVIAAQISTDQTHAAEISIDKIFRWI
jgi:signal transduction histidine kinase